VSVARAAPAGAGGLPVEPLNPEPWRTAFSHANETTAPGFYSVGLPQADALAELTVSGLRGGLHRYTCAPTSDGAPCVLIFNGCHRSHDGKCGPGALALAPTAGGAALALRAALTEDGAFAGDCGGVRVYLYAEVAAGGVAAAAPSVWGLWSDGVLRPGSGNASSTGASGSLGGWASWAVPAGGAPLALTLRVGLSFTSLAAAEANLVAEQGSPPSLSFEAARAAAASAWAAALGVVTVNDVGFTAADAAAARAKAAAAAAAGAREPDPAAGAAAYAAAGAWLASPDGAAWAARAGVAVAPEALAGAAAEGRARAARAAGMPPLSPPPPAVRLGSFYSSLYHALCAPSTYSDADGAYLGMDGALHSADWRPGGSFLSDLSLWDVYRTQMPLLAVLAPTQASDAFHSMLALAAQTNFTHLPHWVWANCETGCMPGSHGVVVLADFLSKGVPGPDVSVIYRAAAAQLASQDAAEGYASLGFVPVPSSGEPGEGASLTLEYALDDFAGSVIAEAAGQAGDAARWRARSRSYAAVWNPAASAMCPRWANGTFPPCPPLDLPPILLNKWCAAAQRASPSVPPNARAPPPPHPPPPHAPCRYTEGDGLQWTFSVPFNVSGLIALFPSPGAYVELLQGMMVNTSLWAGPLLAALPNPWLWIGNEPSLLIPWQFAWLNSDAWRTQYWVRATLDTSFPLTPDGVPGNDDFGATNAWAVWACLGLYPVAATGNYALASPCFANVTLQLPSAVAAAAGYAHAQGPLASDPTPLLHIVAHNFSASNLFVARAVLNGQPLASPIVSHNDLLPPLWQPRPGQDAAAHAKRRAAPAPSLLEFTLTDTPRHWGV
jgi:putative alpha-1,2-mannosidase